MYVIIFFLCTSLKKGVWSCSKLEVERNLLGTSCDPVQILQAQRKGREKGPKGSMGAVGHGEPVAKAAPSPH